MNIQLDEQIDILLPGAVAEVAAQWRVPDREIMALLAEGEMTALNAVVNSMKPRILPLVGRIVLDELFNQVATAVKEDRRHV